MPDFALPADIPLGPFEGTLVNVHTAKGKSARVHADRSCSALRTKDVRSLTLPLNAETIGRMCRQCAAWRRWARPGTALDIFLQAVAGTGLCYELDIYSTPVDEEWTEEEVRRAVLVLREGDYPPEESENEDLWPEFGEARSTREAVFHQWASAAESLHRALTTINQYPWLGPWAQPKLAQKIEYVEALRETAARFCRREALVAAAAVFQLPDPEFPADDPAFSVLGDAATVRSRLHRLWRRWQESVASDWLLPEHHSLLVYDLERGIERKRKKRDAALSRGEELVAEWTAQAQARADVQPNLADQPVLARVPKGETHEGRHHGDFDASVTRWDLAVLATYTVEADWGRRTMLLRVPAVISERLLSGGSALDCEPGDSGLPASSATREAEGSLTPGILDDTPVAERRPITTAHLRALRAADGPAAEQLAIVFAAENGVEVLPVSVIEKRCAAGWRGVFIAAASDLPASVITPWTQRIAEKDDAAPERLWTRRHRSPRDPHFALHLGVATGEAWLQADLSAPYHTPGERDRALRCLALTRNVDDLRVLDDSIDYRTHTIPVAVWNALLAADGLDLQPFQQEDENEFQGGGIGAPLGVLADVQIYTSDSDPTTMGKGHSPYCSHSRRAGVTKYYDLLTAADLLENEDFDWCSQCGGYAPRRLTDLQLDYYRAAHRLQSIAQRLRDVHLRLDAQELAAMKSELDELREWRPADETAWRGVAARRWRHIVRDLTTRAQER